MENWRFIKENNDYMVSDHGRIMSLKKPQKKDKKPSWQPLVAGK